MNAPKYGKLKIKGTLLNKENPFPRLDSKYNKKASVVSEKMQKELPYINYGIVNTVLPYTIQDDYVRELKDIELNTVVLENKKLKAIFLTDYGARLWSLYDKVNGKELLHKNEVFIPSNLAVRNAWVAGGVEWNVGFTGHSPFTMDKVFVEELFDHQRNIPVLKFYEYERKRKASYFVYAYLPEDSDRLFIRVKIKNYSGKEVPMYWWSNIAVKETTGTRVIAPAHTAYAYNYFGSFDRIPTPYFNRTDNTYSTQIPISKDFFYKLDEKSKKYVAAVDEDGFGLLQASTDRLMSRKLFVWGMNRCYRNWQNFLSKPATPYIEIQAGIAQTQMECIPMPKDEEWDFLEAYGPIKVDPYMAHSTDWEDALSVTGEYVNKKFKDDFLDNELQKARDYDKLNGKIIKYGSGWGKVENCYRKKNNISPMEEFENAKINKNEKIWIDLLDYKFPCPKDIKDIPVSFSIDPVYLEQLEKYIEKNKNNWFAFYTLAIGYAGLYKFDKAKETILKSISLYENTYNLRAYAFILKELKDEKGIDIIKKAFEISDKSYHITKETFDFLIEYEKYKDVIEYYDTLSDELKERGRIKIMLLDSYVHEKNIKKCNEMFAKPFAVDDLKEGEATPLRVWYEYCYLKMENEGIKCDDKKEYVDTHFERPCFVDYRNSI